LLGAAMRITRPRHHCSRQSAVSTSARTCCRR